MVKKAKSFETDREKDGVGGRLGPLRRGCGKKDACQQMVVACSLEENARGIRDGGLGGRRCSVNGLGKDLLVAQRVAGFKDSKQYMTLRLLNI
jgi:hypothetical protein